MSSLRRSTRTKQQPQSYYADTKQELEKKLVISSRKSGTKGSHPVVEEESSHESGASVASTSNDDSTVGSFESVASAIVSPSIRSKKTKLIYEDTQQSSKKRKQHHVIQSRPGNRRSGTNAALSGLGKKVLATSETPENSLVAALFHSLRATGTAQRNASSRLPDLMNTTKYTHGLVGVAQKVIEEHKLNPNASQVRLINFLLRSVGGSFDSILNAETADLERMDSEEWGDVITQVLDDMRHTPAEKVLLCADPKGAIHAIHESEEALSNVGQSEYHKLYDEFWYIIGMVGIAGMNSMPESNPTDELTSSSSVRFAIEAVKDVLVRVVELVAVGQPDIRAAATSAALMLAHAALDWSVEYENRLHTAKRHLQSAKRVRKSSGKAEALQLQVDGLSRICEDLEASIVDVVVQGVFMRRYRDSNMHIRANCIKALSRMTLQRPDIFLKDTYLKYFGWMMSDKSPSVREASLEGLVAPFIGAKNGAYKKSDLGSMEKVIAKFLSRITDCVIDVDRRVQEKAMNLLLFLLRAGFLDDWDDEEAWNRINLRAIARDATPTLRRDALYFVVEQLEPFDSENEKSDKSPDIRDVERLNSIATWIAHSLSDGNIPVQHMRIDLSNYVVHSLRTMPEYATLSTNWSAIIRAVRSSEKSHSTVDRVLVAKHRVLLQMLACSAELEMGKDFETELATDSIDSDLVEAYRSKQPGKASGTSKVNNRKSASQEALSLAILHSLPDLLLQFKGDLIVLRSLTVLPRFLVSHVLSLPNQKKDFLALLQNLSTIFLESADLTILENCATGLTCLAHGDHARRNDAMLQLEKTAGSARRRLLELFKCRQNSSSDNPKGLSAGDKSSWIEDFSLLDVENAITLSLRRLCVLSKRSNLSHLLKRDEGEDRESDALCFEISAEIERRLQERIITVIDNDEEIKLDIPLVWKSVEVRVHRAVADSVLAALEIILSSIAWKVRKSLDFPTSTATYNTNESEPHSVVRMRDELVKLLGLCFDQFLDIPDTIDASPDVQEQFAVAIQYHAGKVAADLRSLLPKEFAESSSPFLRQCALIDDGHLIGGFVRYFRWVGNQYQESEPSVVESSFVNKLLVPLGRGLCANWPSGNRREAGTALSHLVGSGDDAGKIVGALSRVLKRIEPVRLLEAHMACLRQSYADWVDNEPEEPLNPTSQEELRFKEAERTHVDSFKAMEQLAGKLSGSLGVARLSNSKLSPALFGFIKEGVRFSFSSDEELVLGSRLSFLSLLIRYLTWIRRNKTQLSLLREDVKTRESNLFDDPEFHVDDIREEDMAALAKFREDVGLKERAQLPRRSKESFVEEDNTRNVFPRMESRRRLSHTSSVSSIRSRVSTQKSLSPLYEGNSTVDDEKSLESPDTRSK